MNQDCHSRFTQHFPNDKIIFLSAHGWVFKRPEDKGSDFLTSPAVNLGNRVVMTAVTYGTGLKSLVGEAYEEMNKSQLGQMLCGNEQTRIDTLKQVMGDVVWDSLLTRGKQDLQTLATNNVHFGGMMENMGFDFFLSYPRYERVGGKEEKVSIRIAPAGITDFNQKDSLFDRPERTITRSDEAFNKIEIARTSTIQNDAELHKLFDEIVMPYFLPRYAEDSTTELPYNVMLLHYLHDKAMTEIQKTGSVYGGTVLEISLKELLELPQIPNDAMLCILACRADEEPIGDLGLRTQEFEKYIKSLDRPLGMQLSGYCSQTPCSGIVRSMPGPGFSQDAFCKGRGCLSCVPSSDQRSNPTTGEVPMVCKSCVDDYTVLVGCHSSNDFDFACFTLGEMQGIYQQFITQHHSGQNAIEDVPVRLGEGASCVINKMTIAALLCMGNHDIGCAYVREGVRTNLDVFNPDQLQEAYHQFLMYAVYPFIYVPQNMMKDLYDRTLGRVMTEYATHITNQFETTPDRFMEIICQKTGIDLSTYRQCEQSLLAYISLTLSSLAKILKTSFPDNPNGLQPEYRDAISRWVHDALVHLPEKGRHSFVDSSGEHLYSKTY